MTNLKRVRYALCLFALLILCGWSSLPTEGTTTIDAATDAETPTDITPDTISAIAWSPDQDRIAVGKYSGTVEIRDNNGQLLHSLEETTSYVVALTWRQDGEQLSSTTGDKTVRIWDTATWNIIFVLPHSDLVWSAIWSSDSSQIITNIASTEVVSDDLSVWSATTGELLNQFDVDGNLLGIVLSPDGNKLALALSARMIQIWDATTYTPISEFDKTRTANGDLVRVIWSPAGDFFAVGRGNGAIEIWNAVTGEIDHEVSDADFESSFIRAYGFGSDGSHLYSVSTDGTIRNWDITTWELLQTSHVTAPVYAAAFSPDGTQLAYGGLDGILHIVPTPVEEIPVLIPQPTP